MPDTRTIIKGKLAHFTVISPSDLTGISFDFALLDANKTLIATYAPGSSNLTAIEGGVLLSLPATDTAKLTTAGAYLILTVTIAGGLTKNERIPMSVKLNYTP